MKRQDNNDSLINSLATYKDKLEALEQARMMKLELITSVLLARDHIQRGLNDDIPDKVSHLIEVNKLDERLRKLSSKIAIFMPMQSFRNTRSAPANAWWWNLDQQVEPSPTTWRYNAATSLLSVIILGFVLDIAPRFMDGGSDTWGIIIIILQGLMAVFAVNVLFSEEGKGAVDRLLDHIHVSQQKLPKIRLAATLCITLIMFGLWLALPWLSQWYSNQGYTLTQPNELRLAESEADFKRALRLNANNYNAHYKLGDLYETLSDYEQARTEYTIAAKSGFDKAYSNLGRLLVLQGDYAQAVQVINQGLSRTQCSALRYSLHKNLGWARLKQTRYEDALTALQSAMKDADKANSKDPHCDKDENTSVNKIDAYCLRAQALDAQESKKGIDDWRLCKARAGENDSLEMDEWQSLAEKNLNNP